jgi:hypothetical protein
MRLISCIRLNISGCPALAFRLYQPLSASPGFPNFQPRLARAADERTDLVIRAKMGDAKSEAQDRKMRTEKQAEHFSVPMFLS